jgi:hypothetical protein
MNQLVVVWKTADLIDIHEFVIPYIHNSKTQKWWDEVEVIIWGASQKVVAFDQDIQKRIVTMQEAGIIFHACKKCADDLCVTDHLEQIGIDVIYTGKLLTQKLQSDAKVLTL